MPALNWLIAAAAAAVLVWWLLGRTIGFLRARALAKPNERSSHKVPTPQGAGIVVVPVALAVSGLALAAAGAGAPVSLTYGVTVALAALALTAISFTVDRRHLSIGLRLAVQVSAVALAVFLLPADLRLSPAAVPLAAERAVLVLAGLWFVNLVNFMDGIDWISVVEVVSVTLGIALLAGIGLVPASLGLLAAAMGGAMLGFAPWNAPPARLFLGDAGSVPLGFLLAVLLLQVALAGAWIAALILPLYYLTDATVTLLRRLVRGERIWQAHRQHFYQQATRNGYSVAETVGSIAILNLFLITLALAASVLGGLWAFAALAIAILAVAGVMARFAAGR